MKIGTNAFYAIVALILVAIITLPQCAWSSRNGLIAINSDYSFELLEWNLVALFVYYIIVSLLSIDKIAEGRLEWEHHRRVPFVLHGVALSLTLWSCGWLSYINNSHEETVIVPGWGEYSLVGPMIFWCVVLLSTFALCAVTGSIFANVARGKTVSFQGLLLFKPD